MLVTPQRGKEETMGPTDVLVGVDGSASGLTALRWAATEASRRGAALRVLLAYHWRFPGVEQVAGEELAETNRTQAHAIVADAVARAGSVAPGLDVYGSAAEGQAAAMLLEA